MRCAVLFVALCDPCLLAAEDAKVLTPEEAAKKVDEKVTVQFEVKSQPLFAGFATDLILVAAGA